LVKRNVCFAIDPCGTVPNSCFTASKRIRARHEGDGAMPGGMGPWIGGTAGTGVTVTPACAARRAGKACPAAAAAAVRTKRRRSERMRQF
jgi:hypothetical protein